MIPEFVGRTPVVTQTQALDEDDLVSILTEPKNAVVRQYRKMFQLEDVSLSLRTPPCTRSPAWRPRP